MSKTTLKIRESKGRFYYCKPTEPTEMFRFVTLSSEAAWRKIDKAAKSN